MKTESTEIIAKNNHQITQNSYTNSAMTVTELLNQVNLVRQVMFSVMKKDIHYGIIPGCKKPSLLKPGAETLCVTFRLAAEYDIEIKELTNQHREYIITCNLIHINSSNNIGKANGSCSTLESKYRYKTQNTNNLVPKEYWETRDSKLLGGNNFSPKKVDKTWFIFEKVENDNPADYYNTCLKMAQKRALIAAILNATAASDVFTQDVQDMPEFQGDENTELDKKFYYAISKAELNDKIISYVEEIASFVEVVGNRFSGYLIIAEAEISKIKRFEVSDQEGRQIASELQE